MGMSIYCTGCKKDVFPELITGKEIYFKASKDYSKRWFYRCLFCKAYCGCHGGGRPPLGALATKEMRNARQEIHKILDPMWMGKKTSRSKIYKKLSDSLGYTYHTAEIKTIEDARIIYRVIKNMGN
jgi:hypothetical protein